MTRYLLSESQIYRDRNGGKGYKLPVIVLNPKGRFRTILPKPPLTRGKLCEPVASLSVATGLQGEGFGCYAAPKNILRLIYGLCKEQLGKNYMPPLLRLPRFTRHTYSLTELDYLCAN